MTEKLEVVRGSGNVFADVGLANADGEQAKVLLASEIINILDQEALGPRGGTPDRRALYGFSPHPQRRSRPLHHRPPDENPRTVRPARRCSGRRHAKNL